MKKLNILLLCIFSFAALPSNATTKPARVISENQNIKVKAVSFNNGTHHSEAKLEKILLEELSNGWVYDYNIDISEDLNAIKLLVFKRLPATK